MKYLILPAVLILTSCGGSGGSSSNIDISQFNGLWKSTCNEWFKNDVATGTYFLEDMTLNNGNYTSESISYSDINCTIANGNTDSFTGTYTIKEQVTTSTGLMPNRVTFELVNPINPNVTQTAEYILLKQNNILYGGFWTVSGPYTLLLHEPYTLAN